MDKSQKDALVIFGIILLLIWGAFFFIGERGPIVASDEGDEVEPFIFGGLIPGNMPEIDWSKYTGKLKEALDNLGGTVIDVDLSGPDMAYPKYNTCGCATGGGGRLPANDQVIVNPGDIFKPGDIIDNLPERQKTTRIKISRYNGAPGWGLIMREREGMFEVKLNGAPVQTMGAFIRRVTGNSGLSDVFVYNKMKRILPQFYSGRGLAGFIKLSDINRLFGSNLGYDEIQEGTFRAYGPHNAFENWK